MARGKTPIKTHPIKLKIMFCFPFHRARDLGNILLFCSFCLKLKKEDFRLHCFSHPPGHSSVRPPNKNRTNITRRYITNKQTNRRTVFGEGITNFTFRELMHRESWITLFCWKSRIFYILFWFFWYIDCVPRMNYIIDFPVLRIHTGISIPDEPNMRVLLRLILIGSF